MKRDNNASFWCNIIPAILCTFWSVSLLPESCIQPLWFQYFENNTEPQIRHCKYRWKFL